MAQQTADSRLGDAWNAHRQGRNSEAISGFQAIAQSAPEDIDAHYGLGLALRANGNLEDALQAFQKALALVQARSEQLRGESRGENQLNTADDDRMMMLTRMVNQRISETNRLKK